MKAKVGSRDFNWEFSDRLLDKLNSSTFSGTTLLTGTWQAIGGGIIRLPSTTNIYTNQATIVLGKNSYITNDSSTSSDTALAHFATNNGTFTITNGKSFTTGGAFSNAGTVNISGGPTSALTSTLTVNGAYSQGSSGVLNIQISSASVYDKLIITGAATLGGTLNVTLAPGYTITSADLGKVLTPITYASYTGSFSTINLPDLTGAPGGPLYLVASYGPMGFHLTIIPIPSTVWLLATGLVGMLAVRRRRTRKTQS